MKRLLAFGLSLGLVAALAVPAVAALKGTEWGGGQLIEGDNKISFGSYVDGYAGTGEIQVNFHNVPGDALDGARFHSTSVQGTTWFEGDSATCDAAMNVTFAGTLNGVSGYTLVFRAGDKLDGSFDDTVRMTLSDSSGVIYDTSGGGYPNESSCVGTARTGLDRGNLTILVP